VTEKQERKIRTGISQRRDNRNSQKIANQAVF